MKKRSNGEGSYTKLPSGKWRVQIMIGYSADGKKKVKSITAPTKGEAQQMVREFLANKKNEQSNAKLVLFSEWADTWYDDYKNQVEESTYWNYGIR